MSSIGKKEQTISVCQWCGSKLGTGYFFKCKKCSLTYCFIHRDRHICSSEVNISKNSRKEKSTRTIKKSATKKHTIKPRKITAGRIS